MSKYFIIVFSVSILFFIFTTACSSEKKLGYIQNNSFEEGQVAGLPTAWKQFFWKQDPEFTERRCDSTVSKSGSTSYLIASMKPNDARIGQTIKISEHKKYKLSCWVRTEDIELTGLGANLALAGEIIISEDLRGTNENWQELLLYVNVLENVNEMTVTVGIGGYGSLNTGKAWFDDVLITEVSSIPEGVRTVELNKPIQQVEKTKSTSSFFTIAPNENYLNAIVVLPITLIIIVTGIIYFGRRRN